MSTAEDGAHADLICLATAPAFTPQGTRPQDRNAPAAVRGLQALNVRKRAVQLKWQPNAESDVSHYNIYAARETIAEPQQKYLNRLAHLRRVHRLGTARRHDLLLRGHGGGP